MIPRCEQQHITCQGIGPFSLGSTVELSPIQLARISRALSNGDGIQDFPVDSYGENQPLGGRSPIQLLDLPDIGPVVIKSYTRGGLWGKLNSHWYLRTDKTVRSEGEFQTLLRAKELGVRVPEPVSFVFRGELFYRAWLLTKQIPDHRSLIEISRIDEDMSRKITEEVGIQIGILIRNGIFHVDLHPGNVLVDKEGRPYILDFDKAVLFEGKKTDLRDLYIRRWRRAVIKHLLPDQLTEVFCVQLRSTLE